jgi:hypothetical protein
MERREARATTGAAMTVFQDTKTLLRRALAGESLAVDSEAHSLHELTQIAVALQPGANMAVRNADRMSPIEKASIETASKGRIVFV